MRLYHLASDIAALPCDASTLRDDIVRRRDEREMSLAHFASRRSAGNDVQDHRARRNGGDFPVVIGSIELAAATTSFTVAPIDVTAAPRFHGALRWKLRRHGLNRRSTDFVNEDAGCFNGYTAFFGGDTDAFSGRRNNSVGHFVTPAHGESPANQRYKTFCAHFARFGQLSI